MKSAAGFGVNFLVLTVVESAKLAATSPHYRPSSRHSSRPACPDQFREIAKLWKFRTFYKNMHFVFQNIAFVSSKLLQLSQLLLPSYLLGTQPRQPSQ